MAIVLKYCSKESNYKEELVVTQLCNIYNMHTYANSDINWPIYNPNGNYAASSLPSYTHRTAPITGYQGVRSCDTVNISYSTKARSQVRMRILIVILKPRCNFVVLGYDGKEWKI